MSDNLPANIENPALMKYYEQQNKVVEMRLQGKNYQFIAKATGMKVYEVKEYFAEWSREASNSQTMQERAKESILKLDEHFNTLLAEGHSALESAKDENDYKTQHQILKTIADIESKKVEVLQRAGLIDDQALAEELAAAQEQFDVIKELIRDVTNNCPNCRGLVAKRLNQIGDTNATVISEEKADYDIVDGEVV